MLRAKGSLVLTVMVFSCCLSKFSSTYPLQLTNDITKSATQIWTHDAECHQLQKQYSMLSTHKAAFELYKKAYTLSFDQKWPDAVLASRCAAILARGEPSWRLEAKNLIN